MEPETVTTTEKDEDQKEEIKSTTPITKRSKRRFKDFSLNKKELFTTFKDDEIKEAFKKLRDERSKTEKQKEGDFEMIDPIPKESPFVDAAIQVSQMTLTENLAPTFSTSADARVDFYFHVMEKTDSSQTKSLLEKSWKQNPLDTLKLIAILRDIREGKGIRSQYQDCLFWLYENHPKTLYENLEQLLKFGYWKDCLHMLMVIMYEGYVHPYLGRDDIGGQSQENKFSHPFTRLMGGHKRKSPSKKSKNHFEDNETYNKLIIKHFGVPENVIHQNFKMIELRLKFARERFEKDVKYRLFHVQIAKIFAAQLQKDLVEMKNVDGKEKNEVSLVGKWAPSIEKHFDRYTLISSTIALELVKLLGESKFDVLTKSIPVAVYLSRKCYHKEYCEPLRKFIEVAEVPMSAGQWNLVNYARVPSKCMKRNSKLFQKHDEERFKAYIARPDAKVAGATLKPIEILTSAMTYFSSGSASETDLAVMEKQWLSLVEDIKKKGGGLLKNAVAVCDVSGSMYGDPILAALGLTLITMNMCEPPWNSICITFHENPTIFNLSPECTLMEKVQKLRAMQWGGNTDIHRVFKLILNLGLNKKLTQEQMPSILLVYTDMEFDSAFPGTTKTNFQAAKDLFEANGYKLPAIVFWNLRAKATTTTPVQVNEFGAILVSGFSGQQLSYVMKQEDLSKCTPLQFVLDIIQREKYNNLVVHD